MQKFRLKPADVEALQVTPANVEAAAIWCGGKVERETSPRDSTDTSTHLLYPTINGRGRVSMGNYLIKDGFGVFKDMPGPAFDTIYTPVGKRQEGFKPV